MADPRTDEEWAFQEALPRLQSPEHDGSHTAVFVPVEGQESPSKLAIPID